MRNILVVAIGLFMLCPKAASANWCLGTNLGLTVVDFTETGQESATTFGWPSSGFVNLVGAPALRVGFAAEGSAVEVALESSLMSLSSGGSSFTTATFTGNVQYAFHVAGSTQPFVTADLGAALFRDNDFFFSSASTTAGIVGGGVGMQHRVGHGHGTLRFEVHYDHVAEGTHSGGATIPASNNIGLKLGFDLWMH